MNLVRNNLLFSFWVVILFITILGSVENTYALRLEDLEFKENILESDDAYDPHFSFESFQSVDDQLQQALTLANQGKYKDAENSLNTYINNGNQTSAEAYEILGAAQAMQGQYEQALNTLQQALLLNPNSSSTIVKIGDIDLALGHKKKAEASFQKAVQINQHNRFAHQRLGIMYDQRSNQDRAIHHYQKGLLGTDPKYVGIKVDLARLYNRKKEFKKTINLLGGLITKENDNVSALIVLGTAYFYTDSHEMAIQLYERAKELDLPRGAIALGIAYRQTNHLDQALQELTHARDANGTSPELSFQLAETLVQLNKFQESLLYYNEALKNGFPISFILPRLIQVHIKLADLPKAIQIMENYISKNNASPRDYILLGELFQASSNMEKAENTFLRMVKNFPDEKTSWLRLGMHYGLVKQYDKALQALNRAESLDRNDPQIVKTKAICHVQLGDIDEAIKLATQIVKMRPNNVNDLFYLASLYQDNNQNKKAIENYEKILKLDAGHAFTLNNLAALYADKGNLDKALLFSTNAVAAAPENGRILDTLGWIQYQLNLSDEATVTLTQAKSLAPNIPVIYYHLGVVYNAIQQRELAREHIKKSLQFNQYFKEKADAEKLLNTL